MNTTLITSGKHNARSGSITPRQFCKTSTSTASSSPSSRSSYENRSLPSHCSTDACAKKVAAGVGTVRVDVRSLLRKLRLQQAEMAYLRTWAATAGAAYLPLQYDELRRDPVGVVSRIYAFLGVEAHATRPDLYARSMRRPLSEYVENLDEVREALRGTPWAADPVLTA